MELSIQGLEKLFDEESFIDNNREVDFILMESAIRLNTGMFDGRLHILGLSMGGRGAPDMYSLSFERPGGVKLCFQLRYNPGADTPVVTQSS